MRADLTVLFARKSPVDLFLFSRLCISNANFPSLGNPELSPSHIQRIVIFQSVVNTRPDKLSEEEDASDQHPSRKDRMFRIYNRNMGDSDSDTKCPIIGTACVIAHHNA